MHNLLKLKKRLLNPFLMASAFNIVYGLYYYTKRNAISLFDSGSYSIAGDRLLTTGVVDIFRTPVYPLFLAICNRIKGSISIENFVSILQIIVFYISTYFFYKILKNYSSNRLFLFLATAIYGCSTIIIDWNQMVITESLSISGIVFFAYLFVRYINVASSKTRILIPLCVLFLTLLRPGFVCLFIVVGLVYFTRLLIEKKDKINTLKGIVAFCVSVALLFGYFGLNKIQNNYFGLSSVADLNLFMEVAEAGISQDNSDVEFVEGLNERFDEGSSGYHAAFGVYTDKLEGEYNERPAELIARISSFNRESISLHPGKYFNYLIGKIGIIGDGETLHFTHGNYYKEGVNPEIVVLGDYFKYKINFIYYVLIAQILIALLLWLRKREFPMIDFTMILLVGGQLASNIIAGPGEFHRLNATVYPFVIVILFRIITLIADSIFMRINSTKAKE